jgi:hypothetical protein
MRKFNKEDFIKRFLEILEVEYRERHLIPVISVTSIVSSMTPNSLSSRNNSSASSIRPHLGQTLTVEKVKSAFQWKNILSQFMLREATQSLLSNFLLYK